jgi:hypothetical protein
MILRTTSSDQAKGSGAQNVGGLYRRDKSLQHSEESAPVRRWKLDQHSALHNPQEMTYAYSCN